MVSRPHCYYANDDARCAFFLLHSRSTDGFLWAFIDCKLFEGRTFKMLYYFILFDDRICVRIITAMVRLHALMAFITKRTLFLLKKSHTIAYISV